MGTLGGLRLRGFVLIVSTINPSEVSEELESATTNYRVYKTQQRMRASDVDLFVAVVFRLCGRLNW